MRLALQWFGLSRPLADVTLLLPIGLSFYAFQGIAYSIDIYRKKIAPAGLLDVALYLGFFPKLIAGPIVRPQQFFAQINSAKSRPGKEEVSQALSLLILGLFKKVVIADTLATLGYTAFRAAALPPGGGLFPGPLYLQGFYLYAFEIYADFSGYTDIARASAALLGFSLPENFKQPYLSTTVTTFWNRWHMSLTQWFREYLFFPLSRKLLSTRWKNHPQVVQAGVTMLTMVLIGVWHGAAWTFVVWGAWQGTWLIVEQRLRPKPERWITRILWSVMTFHLIGIGWIFFGSSSLAAALRFLQGLFVFDQPSWLFYYGPSVVVTALVVIGIDLFQSGQVEQAAKPVYELIQRHQVILTIAASTLLVLLYLLMQAHGEFGRPFIYGKF